MVWGVEPGSVVKVGSSVDGSAKPTDWEALPEGDKSDNRSYQVPANIADN